MGAVDHVALVGPLEELVDLRRFLDDRDELVGVHLELLAEVEGAPGALVVGGDRHELEDPRDLLGGEAVLAQGLVRLAGEQPLRAGAGVHPLGGDPDDPPAGAGVGRGDPDDPYISWVGMPVTGVRFSTG